MIQIYYHPIVSDKRAKQPICVDKNQLLDAYHRGELPLDEDVWINQFNDWKPLKDCHNELGISATELGIDIISNMTECIRRFKEDIVRCQPQYTGRFPYNQVPKIKQKYKQYNIFLYKALQQLQTSDVSESDSDPDSDSDSDAGRFDGGKSVIKVIPKKQKKQIRRLYKGPRGGKYYKRKNKKIYVK
jgi:hypothetical protein